MSLKDIRPALRAFLIDDPVIAAATVKNGGGAWRVTPIIMDQGDKAASIVYSRISAQGDHTNDGPSGLARQRIQIDCYAPKTSDASESLALRVHELLDGFSGVMGSGDAAVNVQGVFFDNMREGYEDDTKLYFSGADYFFWLEER